MPNNWRINIAGSGEMTAARLLEVAEAIKASGQDVRQAVVNVDGEDIHLDVSATGDISIPVPSVE